MVNEEGIFFFSPHVSTCTMIVEASSHIMHIYYRCAMHGIEVLLNASTLNWKRELYSTCTAKQEGLDLFPHVHRATYEHERKMEQAHVMTEMLIW